MLQVNIEICPGVTVVRCEGQIVAGKEISVLINSVIFHRDEKFVVLDLACVDKIDARGLGVLVLLRQWTRSVNAKLQVVPSKQVRKMLELTGLMEVLEVRRRDRCLEGGRHSSFPHRGTEVPSPDGDDDSLAAAS